MIDDEKDIKNSPELVYKVKDNGFGLGKKALIFIVIMVITAFVLIGLTFLTLILIK